MILFGVRSTGSEIGIGGKLTPFSELSVGFDHNYKLGEYIF